MRSLKERGFSLVETMVAVGVSAGVALIAANLLSDQQFNQNYLRVMSEVDKQHSLIQASINKPLVCNFTFAGVELPTGNSDGVPIPKIFQPTTSGGEIVIAFPNVDEATWMNTSVDFRVKSLVLRNPTATSKFAPMREKIKELVVTYELKRKFFSNTVIQKPMNVFMTMTPTGLFRECGSVLSDTKSDSLRKMCESLGPQAAEWVEVANYGTQIYPSDIAAVGAVSDFTALYPNGKCQLKDFRCPQGSAPRRVDSLGWFVCTPVSQKIDWYSKVDSTPIDCVGANTFQIADVDGKLKIVCSGGAAPPACVPNCAAAGSICMGQTFPNGCGGTCSGTVAASGTWTTGPWDDSACPGGQRTRAVNCNSVCGGMCDATVMPTSTRLCMILLEPETCYNSCFEAGYDCTYGTHSGYGGVPLTLCNGATQYCSNTPPSGGNGAAIPHMCLSAPPP